MTADGRAPSRARLGRRGFGERRWDARGPGPARRWGYGFGGAVVVEMEDEDLAVVWADVEVET
jgi:hypothetical protein